MILARKAPDDARVLSALSGIGVGLGALLYYLRIRRDEASPLTVQLREYAEDMEKNAQANPS